MGLPILLTVETACDAIASSLNVSAYEGLFSKVQFYTGIDNETKVGPCVICACDTAEVETPNVPALSGNWIVNTKIIVKERANKASRETTTLADTIYRGFLTGSIETDLESKDTNLKVFTANVGLPTSNVEGKYWVETLPLSVFCCLKA